MSVRSVIPVVCSVALALTAAPAAAQVVEPPFDGAYVARDIGTPPGVPSRLGGLTMKAGTTDRLLIGGAANGSTGALYEIGLVRDGSRHIVGFSGPARRVADAAYNDGGVTYGPGGVLFLARWPEGSIGQTRPGSTRTDKIVPLAPFGVSGSPGALMFVPPGHPGAGSLKIASYDSGQWYDAAVSPDGAGTYNLVNVTAVPGVVLSGPEGFVYVNAGSPQFLRPSVLVSEYGAGSVAAFAVDANGDPIVSTRRTFISGLSGAEGALIDPVTGDFLFSTFGGGDRVVVVRGFARPLPPPVAGRKVNALPAEGTVRIDTPGGGGFVVLKAGQQIPPGTVVDTTRGRVTLVAAAGRNGQTATADFYAGVFKLSQTRRRRPLTTLKLVGKLSCAGAGKASATRKKKRRRRLWGDGRGRFRTRGEFSSATVRGTKWLTEDRCGETLTRVKRGKVAVRDFARRKTVIVRAGRKYIARPKTNR